MGRKFVLGAASMIEESAATGSSSASIASTRYCWVQFRAGLADIVYNTALKHNDGGDYFSTIVSRAYDHSASMPTATRRPGVSFIGKFTMWMIGCCFHVHGETESGSVDF